MYNKTLKINKSYFPSDILEKTTTQFNIIPILTHYLVSSLNFFLLYNKKIIHFIIKYHEFNLRI